MCGIFGVITSDSKQIPKHKLKKIINDLFKRSESRGKDCAGISFQNLKEKKINVLKTNIPASEFIKSKDYKKIFQENTLNFPFSCIGHSRLITNGSELFEGNNQPIIKNGIVGVHNGIITNIKELRNSFNTKIERIYEIDTELILDSVYDGLSIGNSVKKSICKTFEKIEGSASLALQFNFAEKIILATNTGSLYYLFSNKFNSLIFASEQNILESVLKKNKLACFDIKRISQLNPFNGIEINLKNLDYLGFNFNKKDVFSENENLTPVFEIVNYSNTKSPIIKNFNINNSKLPLEFNIDKIKLIKRCKKCILPETFPFILFDENGVCNYCNNSKKNNLKNESELIDVFSNLKKHKNNYDVIAPISGGRDSVYGLHIMVKKYGLRPLTFTYDWGMVTDLARRNIAKITGKLGVENIIVSADINKKREYIKKNILSWLNSPDLGIIPLFMAGDKWFFKEVNKLKRNTGIYTDIWSGNPLENTDFKTGFCGVSPNFNKDGIDSLPFWSKIKLQNYYLKKYFLNPKYFNSSLYDTIGAYLSYYYEPRNSFYQLFDYIEWKEEEVENTIFNEYNFELAKDTNSSWRIGDGTAAFYNYIYYTVAGFSEFDTFRSNQIRRGHISRQDALEKINLENAPRIDSLMWYLNILQLDPELVIKKINLIPKLYS